MFRKSGVPNFAYSLVVVALLPSCVDLDLLNQDDERRDLPRILRFPDAGPDPESLPTDACPLPHEAATVDEARAATEALLTCLGHDLAAASIECSTRDRWYDGSLWRTDGDALVVGEVFHECVVTIDGMEGAFGFAGDSLALPNSRYPSGSGRVGALQDCEREWQMRVGTSIAEILEAHDHMTVGSAVTTWTPPSSPWFALVRFATSSKTCRIAAKLCVTSRTM